MIEKIKNELNKLSKTEKILSVTSLIFSCLFFFTCIFAGLSSNYEEVESLKNLDENDTIALQNENDFTNNLEDEAIKENSEAEVQEKKETETTTEQVQEQVVIPVSQPDPVTENNNQNITPVQEENTQETVFITETGEKYHGANCRSIRGKNTYEVTLQEALNKGLEPCKICQ